MALSLAVTLGLGTVLNALERRGTLAPTAKDTTANKDQCCKTECAPEELSGWRRFLTELLANLRSLTPYLLVGLFVAALISHSSTGHNSQIPPGRLDGVHLCRIDRVPALCLRRG